MAHDEREQRDQAERLRDLQDRVDRVPVLDLERAELAGEELLDVDLPVAGDAALPGGGTMPASGEK